MAEFKPSAMICQYYQYEIYDCFLVAFFVDIIWKMRYKNTIPSNEILIREQGMQSENQQVIDQLGNQPETSGLSNTFNLLSLVALAALALGSWNGSLVKYITGGDNGGAENANVYKVTEGPGLTSLSERQGMVVLGAKGKDGLTHEFTYTVKGGEMIDALVSAQSHNEKVDVRSLRSNLLEPWQPAANTLRMIYVHAPGIRL